MSQLSIALADRPGTAMQCHSGTLFYFLDPRPEDILIEDIAYHLSHLNRFNGATSVPYSVAEHCVRVSAYLEATTKSVHVAFAGLLHDAAEAYCGDVSAPLKALLGASYVTIERGIQDAIDRKFGLDRTDTVSLWVRAADLTLLATEKRDLMPAREWPHDLPQPLAETITPWRASTARRNFLARFKQLGVRK